MQFSSYELNKLSDEQWRHRLNKSYSGGLIPPKQYKINRNYAEKLITAIDKLKDVCKTNAFVFPALEDNEIIDYYLDKNLDKIRTGRICTTPWVNPTIHSNGDVSNCIGNIIGNINNCDFWEIWNNEKANNLRECLCKYGKFTLCAKCCNFYKGNFIYAPNNILKCGDKILKLPGELNYVKSSRDGVFIKDKSTQNSSENIETALPVEIFNEATLKEVAKNEEIIANFNEIEGV